MTTNREVWDELTHFYRCRIFAGWFLAQDNKMVQLIRNALANWLIATYVSPSTSRGLVPTATLPR